MEEQEISIDMASNNNDGNDKILCSIFWLNLIMGRIQNACSDCLEQTIRIWRVTLCNEQFIANAGHSSSFWMYSIFPYHWVSSKSILCISSHQIDTISLFRLTSH